MYTDDCSEESSRMMYTLMEHPETAARCNWERLDGELWENLLASHPEYAEHCEWEKLDGEDWARLLINQPQLADKCDWELLQSENWADLLEYESQFADKCPAKKKECASVVETSAEGSAVCRPMYVLEGVFPRRLVSSSCQTAPIGRQVQLGLS